MAATARADEVKHLQMQVDQLKERLDFISPMLPLVNFVQDFFQQVECEASLQLMRLRKAQVIQHQLREDEEDGASNAQLETAKFLHFIADAVIASRLGGSATQATPEPASSPQHASFRQNSLTVKTQESERSGGYLLSRQSSTALVEQRPFSFVEARQVPSFGLTQPSSPKASKQKLAPADDEIVAMAPFAEPGTGGTAGAVWEELPPLDVQGPKGLILGKGSWANAYRQAHGTRREALRLLCTSGIVTMRELSDDLTVIDDAHINECILIASEMLQTWPLQVWVSQPLEAQKVFEKQLTALYQRKFSEQKA